MPVAPGELRDAVDAALRRVREAHEGDAPKLAEETDDAPADGAVERPAGPVAPERFGVLQALLAYLLAACGEGREATIPARDLIERFPIPPDSLEEHLSLLNLVNFGGGCYAVYAELRGDEVHVDKELFGDTFRAPPRLTPLEARAIRLALEFVGPTIAADSHTTLDRVRRKLEETFGEFDLAQTPEPHSGAEVDLVMTLTEAIQAGELVEIEYLKEGDQTPSTRLVEPYTMERELPYWYVHTWDRTRDGARSFRLDRMRSARPTGERFEPRAGVRSAAARGHAARRVLYRPRVARWALEKGGRELADGSAVRELQAGEDWLVPEILSYGGEAVLVEPAELRSTIAERAAELEATLASARPLPRRPRAARA